LAGSSRDSTSGAEGRCGTQNRSDIAGVLDTCKNYKKQSAGVRWRAKQFVESRGARADERGDALRVLGVGKAFEEAVGGPQRGKSHLWPVNQRRESLVMTLAGFAEEDRFDGAAGAQGLFDESDTFDADGSGFRGQTAAERHAELFEPAILPAGKDSGRGGGGGVAGGFARRGHQGERNKFRV
jgi:hypothetical protein